MGKKNKIEVLSDEIESTVKVPKVPEISESITSEDFQELSGGETNEEFPEFFDSSDVKEDTEFFQKAPEGKSLSALNKEIKEKMKAEGKSTRFTTTESKKTYAAARLAASLAKRGWKMNSDGVYELSGHALSIDIEGFQANVDGYILPLGGGALKTLDQYVALSKATADQDTPSLSS